MGDRVVDETFASNVRDAASLEALRGCVECPGSVYITDTHATTTLAPLAPLRVLGGELKVRGNATLRDLDGLEGVVQVAWHLDVVDNPVLERVAAQCRGRGC